MVVFIVSLAVLFMSTIVAFVLVGQIPDVWLPDLQPLACSGLAAGTLSLLVNGALLQRALTTVRRSDPQTAMVGKLVTFATVFGCLFLLLQAFNWFSVFLDRQPTPSGVTPNAFFYVLSGLHALHVLGGIVPLVLVCRRARVGGYNAEDYGGLLHCTMYWHFLDGVWLTTLAVILVAS